MMKIRLRTIAFLILAAISTAAGAQEPATTSKTELSAEIQIQADHVIGPVNPLIFGHNIEAADTAGIFGAKTQTNKILYGDGFWEPKLNLPSPAVMQKARDIGVRMIRYPGGCLVHNFDWRKAVGPREQRPDWPFGVDEFLRVCRELGAEPLITMSDYVLPAEEMPRHLADFVEYLNAPATPEHPWAMKRKEWGHADPHGVIWFELGNETNHGNHNLTPKRLYSPAAYAEYATASIRAMKAVDPNIRIGIISEDTGAPESQWNRVVLREAGPYADFYIIHRYPGGIKQKITPELERKAMLTAMASINQSEDGSTRYRAAMKKFAGRVLPIAITEYNCNMQGDKPKPYRFTLGGALLAADTLRFALEPDNGIIMANYWQMFDGYFGSVRVDMSKGADFTIKQLLPAYWCYRLWGQHFGAELTRITIKSPVAASPGVESIKTQASSGIQKNMPPERLAEIPVAPLDISGFKKESARAMIQPDGTLAVRLKNFTGMSYPTVARLEKPQNAASGCDYRFTCEARYIADPGSDSGSLGMGLCDLRGWDTTRSAVSIPGIEDEKWQSLYGEFVALPDAPGVSVIIRLEPGGKKMSGLLEIRNMRLEAYTKRIFPTYELVTASASLSADHKTLYVIVFNKSAEEPVATSLNLSGFKAVSARRWEVTGKSIESIYDVRETLSGASERLTGDRLHLRLPPHSMSAIEFKQD